MCHNNTILVAGSTGDWATAALILTSASIETYSDGYKMTMSAKINSTPLAFTVAFQSSNCIKKDANSSICFALTTSGLAAKVAIAGNRFCWLDAAATVTNFALLTTAILVVNLGTPLSLATHGMVQNPVP
jgi:hypothetical protein